MVAISKKMVAVAGAGIAAFAAAVPEPAVHVQNAEGKKVMLRGRGIVAAEIAASQRAGSGAGACINPSLKPARPALPPRSGGRVHTSGRRGSSSRSSAPGSGKGGARSTTSNRTHSVARCARNRNSSPPGLSRPAPREGDRTRPRPSGHVRGGGSSRSSSRSSAHCGSDDGSRKEIANFVAGLDLDSPSIGKHFRIRRKKDALGQTVRKPHNAGDGIIVQATVYEPLPDSVSVQKSDDGKDTISSRFPDTIHGSTTLPDLFATTIGSDMAATNKAAPTSGASKYMSLLGLATNVRDNTTHSTSRPTQRRSRPTPSSTGRSRGSAGTGRHGGNDGGRLRGSRANLVHRRAPQ